MTAVATLESVEPGPPVGEDAPRLAPGVELLGPYRDSGLRTPPYLMRRAGRILQVSRLLYEVAAAANGARTSGEIATVAGIELDRPLTADNIRLLVQNKLAPAGILTIGTSGPSVPAAPAAPPPEDTRLLALRFRRALVSPQQMNGLARLLGGLFRAPMVAGVLAGVAALDIWLFGVRGVGDAVEAVTRTPALLFLAVLLLALSGVFHELGHAAACRYSGGRPGAAGVGLYLCWPVFYTNVTDAYRLDRRGRIRTDLGGLYFNAIIVLALGVAYGVTRYEPLLAMVVLEHVAMLHQLIPWLRLDGYYIVSDLTGVPDILSRVRPALVSLIPGRPTHPDVAALRPRARWILFAYLASIVVFLVAIVIPALLMLPRTLPRTWAAMGPHLGAMAAAAGQWDTIMVVARALAVAMLALPTVGLALMLGLVGRRLARRGAGLARRARRAARVPFRRRTGHWLDSTGFTIVPGREVPSGGSVDYLGFGRGGEVVLFGTAIARPGADVAAGLQAAAAELGLVGRVSLVLLTSPDQVARIVTKLKKHRE